MEYLTFLTFVILTTLDTEARKRYIETVSRKRPRKLTSLSGWKINVLIGICHNAKFAHSIQQIT